MPALRYVASVVQLQRRLQRRLLLAMLAVGATALLASAEAESERADTEMMERQSVEAEKQASESKQEDLTRRAAGFLGANYLHFSYAFEFTLPNVYKQGRGAMWLWNPPGKEDGGTVFRLRGEAQIAGIGNTELTLLALPDEKRLYAVFNVEALDEEQCTWYPFPKLTEFSEKLKLIETRSKLLLAKDHDAGSASFDVQWTKSNLLKVRKLDDGSFKGVDIQRLQEDGTLQPRKSFTVQGPVEQSDSLPEGAKENFFTPPASCKPASELPDEQKLGQVVLMAPHQKSSALNDLLLVLESPELPREFVALSACALPGDTSVVLEQPPPPHFELLGELSFDYSASVFRSGEEHESNGSVWFNLGERAFRVFGEASDTRLGDLKLDVLARTTPKAEVFTHAVIPAEGDDECDSYPYPEMPHDGIAELKAVNSSISADVLLFNQVDTVDNEDCAVYTVPLPRGRLLLVWVDMEENTMHGIRRIEVQLEEQVLRRIDIHHWRSGDTATGESTIRAPKSWHCEPIGQREDSPEGALVKFGLHNVHGRSLALRDALYAVRELALEFAVLELLALPGDISVVVAEPIQPDLSWSKIPGLSFNYSLAMPWIPETVHMGGQLLADSQRGLLRITAGAPGFEQLDVFVGKSSLDVKVQPLVESSRCPDEGYRGEYGRCWYVSAKGASCRETCAGKDLAFDYTVADDSMPMLPTLLGFQPNHKGKAWARLECYMPSRHEYRPAKEQAEPDALDDAREPGDWTNPECRLACPCSIYTHSNETQCLSFPLPENDSGESTTPETIQAGSFISVDTFNGTECNVFDYLSVPVDSGDGDGDGDAEEAVVQLWYEQKDQITAHRMELDIGPEKALASIVNFTAWEVSKRAAESIQIPEGWNCRLADEVYHAWLTLAPTAQLAREAWEQPCEDGDCPLAAGATLRSLAQAAGVVHMLPPAAQSLLSRLVAWQPGARASKQDSHAAPIEFFSSKLKSFSFSFSSAFPLQAAESAQDALGGEAGEGRRHGIGELRVDLEKQLLFLRSEAVNVSRGIPYMESKVIHRGDLGQLIVKTSIAPSYEKCWSVQSPLLADEKGKPQPNPFQRAKLAGRGFSVPTVDPLQGAPVKADKYALHVTPSKRADFFLDKQSRLVAMYLNDLHRDVTAGVRVQDWDTKPVDMNWFKVEQDEQCEEIPFPGRFGGMLADWDLLSVFFPMLKAQAPPSPSPSAAPEAQPADGFTCRPGRGELGFAHLQVSADNSRAACAAQCRGASGCMAFDFTNVASERACRLYGINAPRSDAGLESRQYCEMKPMIDAETQQRRLGLIGEQSLPPRRRPLSAEEPAGAADLVSV